MRAMCAVVLINVALTGTAMASDLPKDGTIKGSYFAHGISKATPVGKDRLLLVFDEIGLQLTDGLLDHTTAHCFGSVDFISGMGQSRGYCVFTDTAGDQVVANFQDEKHRPDQKSWNGKLSLTTGTGKYAGISGGSNYVIHGNEFRPLADGGYVNYVTFEGSYKLQ